MLALIFWAGERICRRVDGQVRFLVNLVGEVEHDAFGVHAERGGDELGVDRVDQGPCCTEAAWSFVQYQPNCQQFPISPNVSHAYYPHCLSSKFENDLDDKL
jgi:hypothetical protein